MAARIGERAHRLGETPAAQSVRGSVGRRLDRVGSSWFVIAQTGLAAGASWQLANWIVGAQYPFFAPVSAVISLSLARGQPRGRALELVLGVAVGIGVADLLVKVIGTGTPQIALVVLLAMVAALLLGAGTLLVNQAAISAILVMTLPIASGGDASLSRFLDALIGSGVALVIAQLLFRRDPVVSVAEAARPVLDELALSLDEAASGLRTGELSETERALQRARGLDDEITSFYDAIAVARETTWMSRRDKRGHLRVYADTARQVDYAVRNVRVLARAAATSTREGGASPGELAEAVELLARSVRALAEELSDPLRDEESRRLARAASAQATEVLAGHNDLRTSMIVGQIRATAVDLLRGTGMDTDAARSTVGAFGPRA